MTDRAKKISELTTKASLANSDVFVIVDTAANTTKKVTSSVVSSYAISGILNANVAIANSATFTANSSHHIILADPAAINDDITITLSNSASNGKCYTVKQISDGYTVTIESDDIELSDATGSISTSTTISYPECVTWVYYNGTYRIVNKF